MTKGILGRKVGMTQIFDAAGLAIPVTVVKAGPCHVLQVRTQERDGYAAVQLGFEDKPRRLAIRAERGHVAPLSSKRSKKLQGAGVALPEKANCEPKRFIREFRGVVDGDAFKVGTQIDLNVLGEVKAIDVTAYTKGRGFTGAMKRWNFGGQRATHGVKKVHRHMGGTGALAANRGGGRMKKGKKMPGRYGNEKVTIRNLAIARVDLENNLLLIHGAVPGPNGGFVMIRESNKVGKGSRGREKKKAGK
jgi:large subunit ribosomal protein L3